jgi:hypothetical protein
MRMNIKGKRGFESIKKDSVERGKELEYKYT